MTKEFSDKFKNELLHAINESRKIREIDLYQGDYADIEEIYRKSKYIETHLLFLLSKFTEVCKEN